MLGASQSNFRKEVSLISNAIQPSSILELGCGLGAFLRSNPQFRDKVTAVQRLFSSSDLANLQELGYNIIDRDILDYIKEGFDEVYDLVVCTDVIEHFFRSDALGIIDFCLYRTNWLILVWPTAHPQTGEISSFDRHRTSFGVDKLAQEFDLVHYSQSGFAQIHCVHSYHLAVLRGHMNLANFPRLDVFCD